MQDMYKRRDRKSPFLFPAKRNPLEPTKTFKQTWIEARKKMAFLELIKTLASTTHDIILSAT